MNIVRPKRPYDRSLRNRQAQQTRELILKTTAGLISEAGLNALSMAEVARRAGVSLRTVWRNFPNQEALMEAIDEWVTTLSPVQLGNTAVWASGAPPIDELPELTRRQYRFLDDNATWILANLYWRFTRDDTPPGRRARMRRAFPSLDSIASHLSPEIALRGRVALALLPNGVSWAVLRKDLGLSGAESGEAVAWILGLVIDELKRLNQQAADGREGDRGTDTEAPP